MSFTKKVLAHIGAVLAMALLIATMNAQSAEERAISLEGVQNTRDLGGLRTEDGRTVRKGQLIRSGEIDEIDADGKAALEDIGVTSIVDLRTTHEAAHPAVWTGKAAPTRYNFPLMEKESDEIDQMRANIKSGIATPAQTDQLFLDAFADIPAEYEKELRELFDVLLAQPEDQAVLYHCSGGKDRTGVSTLLVLHALGVRQADIEADYYMSNLQKNADEGSIKIAAQINSARGTQMSPAAVWPTLGVRPAYLEAFYQGIEKNYGSVDAYLREGLGLSDEELTLLRDRYLQ